MNRSCDGCIFHCAQKNGVMKGERLFKFEAHLSGRSRIVSCLHHLSYAQAKFIDYSRDENGAVDGVILRCDRGQGYGFNDGEETVMLRPYQTHTFTHSYTDTSGGTWDNGFFSVRLTLLPFDGEACCWTTL